MDGPGWVCDKVTDDHVTDFQYSIGIGCTFLDVAIFGLFIVIVIQISPLLYQIQALIALVYPCESFLL